MNAAQSQAVYHAEKAAQLLADVAGRKNEGPGFGSVKASSAQAHATLALFYQKAEDNN